VAGEKGSFRGNGLLGQRRGQFKTSRFYGTEGSQGPYSLASGNRVALVPGTESVWLDGELLQQGVERDYVIDYPTGTLTFTSRRPILRESRITVDYEIASSEYQSLLYEAGSGVTRGHFYADWLYHREWDNPDRPTSLALSDSDRALLGAAGDSAGLAVRSGVDSVGAGKGTYLRSGVDTFFVYAGPGLGEFNIAFTYVGPSAGAYRAKGDGTFFYVGEHLGDYSPVVALPLPTETRLLAVRAGEQVGVHRLEMEWAGTANDANSLSGTADQDNQGSAWLGRYSFGERNPIGGSLLVRHRGSHFEAPGRDADVEADHRWGDALGTPAGAADEFNSQLRLGSATRRADLFLEGRKQAEDDRALRTGGHFAWMGGGTWQGQVEVLRRMRTSRLEFEHAEANWQAPSGFIPLSLKATGERQVEGQGYRFAEIGTKLGPETLNLQGAWRRTDSLETAWYKQSDLYRVAGVWRKTGTRVDGGLSANYERRGFTSQAGSEDRVLTESRWLFRAQAWSLRLDHRLSRSQSLSQSEAYVPVEEGRGDYREVNGQIIADPLGNLIRVVNPAAYGNLARQSEKHANLGYVQAQGTFRGEIDLITAETATDADLPSLSWLWPWQIEAGSPTQRRTLRGELSGGPGAYHWFVRSGWEKRKSTYSTRPSDYERISFDGTLQAQAGRFVRCEGRAGFGREREAVLYPYDLIFALGSIAPSVRWSPNTEVVVPLFAQRYWDNSGTRVADWWHLSVRGTARLGSKSRLVIEPTLHWVEAHEATLPLAVADGRPVGLSSEWRADGSLDLSRILVGRLSYRGRAQSNSQTVHRLDVTMEATF
jgi:hypothetical protein